MEDLNYTPIGGMTPINGGATDPIDALVRRQKELQAELERIKTVKTPQLSDPITPSDSPEALSTDVLRGLFRAQIPTSNDPQFGEAFRQSISPAREILANMFNGMSAAFTGNKFKTVRDQAYERFLTEKKLSQEQQQIQQTLLVQKAQIAQTVLAKAREEETRRAIENVRSASNDADRATKLVELQQKLASGNIDIAKFLAAEKQTKIKNALDEYKTRDTGDPLWDASRRKVEAQLAAQGVDISTPEGYNAVQTATFPEWQKLLATKERIGGSETNYTGLTQVVLANPALFTQLPPTIKAQIAPDLAKAGFTDFGKPLGESAINQLTQTRVAINSLSKLRDLIAENKDLLGPIKGLAKFNPFNERARLVQADVNRVKQQVGKELEGGVLRKEDEAKYKEILATLMDQPNVALGKIDGILSDMGFKLNTFLEEQKNAGRTVNSPKMGGTIKMLFPGGVIRDVPANEAREAELKYGGKRQ